MAAVPAHVPAQKVISEEEYVLAKKSIIILHHLFFDFLPGKDLIQKAKRLGNITSLISLEILKMKQEVQRYNSYVFIIYTSLSR